MGFFLGTLLALSSTFLILLVLVQQGKGGGLAGAFGGAGGQSAFGTKAGDVFTRVTIIAALVWIFLCLLMIRYQVSSGSTSVFGDSAPSSTAAPTGGAGATKATDSKPADTEPSGEKTPANGGATAPAADSKNTETKGAGDKPAESTVPSPPMPPAGETTSPPATTPAPAGETTPATSSGEKK